jgi:hypothetical protein
MNTPVPTHPLFNDEPIGEAFERQHRKAAAEIVALSADDLLTRGPDELAAELLAKYLMKPLVVVWGAATDETREVDIDASGNRRGVGTEVIEHIPFSGPDGLFDMRPTGHTNEPPTGCVRDSELLITHVGTAADPAAFQLALERERSAVRAFVSRVAADITRLNADLEGKIRAELQTRMAEIRTRADLSASLGIPVRQGPPKRPEGTAYDERRPLPAAGVGPKLYRPLGRGRPAWTRELFEEQWRAAWVATPERKTFKALANHFRALDGMIGGLGGDHLGRLHKRFLGDT